MGAYVNSTSKGKIGASFNEKCDALKNDGAIELDYTPQSFQADLVCVVDNGLFAAAAHLFSEAEFEAFTNPNDRRPKRFFVWDKVKEFSN